MAIVIAIVILGLLFDFTNGFHDAANVVATPIATKIVRPVVALLIATAFNFVGATQISGVAQTITTGLVTSQDTSQLMVLSAVAGAIFWNLVTWFFGIPSSSSYALVGGLVGAAMVQGSGIVLWSNLCLKVILPMILSPMVGYAIAFFTMRALLKVKSQNHPIFRYLQLGSASFLALSHGLNDAQKSMAIITLGLFSANIVPTTHIPLWVVAGCAIMMALGTASGGFRIIRTVGYEITHLKPIQGFGAEASASVVILAASFLGMPLSSTHIITGSITGVGSAKGVRSVKWITAKKIVFAWILTLPGSALFSAFLFKLLLSS